MGVSSWLGRVRRDYRERGEARLGRYGTFWSRFAVSPWRWSVALCKFDNEPRWVLHLFCLWGTLGRAKTPPKDCMLDEWGFTFSDRTLHLNWGHKTKIVYMPWMFDHCRVEAMLRDGSFIPYEWWTRHGETPEPADIYRETFPYTYTLRSGEVQRRLATVTVERRSWCWHSRPFKWLRWPSMVRTSIDVAFDDEVGEGTGSWKGGCVGCGYDLQPGETPEQCLRRMEAERKFER